MIHNYNKPSELLTRQKQTGESYWDMIGNPLPDFKRGKNPYQEFVKTHRRGLYRYLKAHDLPLDALDNMVRQLAYESNYGRSNIALKQHNYGGYGYNGKTYTTFADNEAFYKAYVNLINKMGALGIANTSNYARTLGKHGYYSDSPEHYISMLGQMKQADRWINDEIKNQQMFYKDPLMKLSDFGPQVEQQQKQVIPADNANVQKPQIVPDKIPHAYITPQPEEGEVTQYKSNLPDIMTAYNAMVNGQMPLQMTTLKDYGYDDYTEA